MRGSGAPDHEPTALLAKALYDNLPDCSDELAFCRGDILTILEQHVPESEGWWKCVLRGRQGLAPANRLQMLTKAPTARPWPPHPGGLEVASPEEAYQVPSLLAPPPPGPVYEHMRSWVETRPPPSAQLYEIPDPPASARIICEKAQSFQKQVSITLPRPMVASLPMMPSQVYDVPTQRRAHPASTEPEKPQLYDIPTSPQKAILAPRGSQASKQGVPRASQAMQRGDYSTLPSPLKPAHTFDHLESPEKGSVTSSPLSSVVEEARPRPAPRFILAYGSLDSRSQSQQRYRDLSRQKKLSLPEIPSSDLPVPRDEGVSYKVPSSFLIPRVEQQNTKPNIYDIPKAMASAPQGAAELDKAAGVAEMCVDHSCPRLSAQVTASPEPDSLWASGSGSSRASLCSSTSTESSSSSSSEELPKELPVDPHTAKEMVTALQHKVALAVEGLLLFVSRKWRFRQFLEASLDAVHRAVDHTEESLREFLDFARGVRETASNLSDCSLQVRMKDQLHTISCSYQVLLETKQNLDRCHWSLEALVTDKVQNSPDDLERFVMAARMVPEDTKRFASMVIANGRLLFKQSSEKEEPQPWTVNSEHQLEKCTQSPQRETEPLQTCAPSDQQKENDPSHEGGMELGTSTCGQVPGPGVTLPLHLSQHCRLYFGALFKALGVLAGSLSHGQPPETFITHSKLVIVVGQKLVDALCKETQERDARNEVLRGSSHLCSLLRNVALATKDAALRHPSPAALQHLQAQAQKLEQHARHFRGVLE
ncbi:cas scaffolding protein family member 4 [Echinops telfairi]|uniref:Cas scaffolding protein family member 4 n=3 Tax=Echinops telfairi TaxID=9371 RepID=A0AC55DHU8_ECHTE|nr:cas scaffolding protein family member 4 [Echinops telfairi]XP_045151322.1 cas scaffolding protein family member 4 [Echinops telfairi]XP_045151323.1 cas scaffolding protein family member 4 [Echinops telfairi]